MNERMRNAQSMPTLSRKCGHALSVPHSFIQSVRERKREKDREKRERHREKEIERETERERDRGERERGRERDVEYGCFNFLFKSNDGCLGTFKLSSVECLYNLQ
jgi:hypothetical protein